MKYRKKPIVIEAVQWTGDNFSEVAKLSFDVRGPYGQENPYLEIVTLEGRMRAELLDWVIKGIKGEVYPCKPDIFRATYELEKEPVRDGIPPAAYRYES